MLYNPANGNRLRVFSWDRFDKNVYVLVLEDMLNGFPYRHIFNSCHFQDLNSHCILNKTKVILLFQFDVFLRLKFNLAIDNLKILVQHQFGMSPT